MPQTLSRSGSCDEPRDDELDCIQYTRNRLYTTDGGTTRKCSTPSVVFGRSTHALFSVALLDSSRRLWELNVRSANRFCRVRTLFLMYFLCRGKPKKTGRKGERFMGRSVV